MKIHKVDENDDDISMLMPLPPLPQPNNNLYSWAYHKYERIGKKLGQEGEILKCLCRAKGRKVLELYGVEE